MDNFFSRFDPDAIKAVERAEPSYRTEASLRNFARLTPEETARDEAFDRTSANRAELDRQIEAYRNQPAQRAVLEAERDRLSREPVVSVNEGTEPASANFFSRFDPQPSPSGNFFERFGGEPQVAERAKPRGAIAEIGTQLWAGASIDLPKMVGQALRFMGGDTSPTGEPTWGKELQEWAEKRERDNPDLRPQPDPHGFVTNTLAAGARAIVPSVAAMAPAIAAAPFGIPATIAASAAASFGLFGQSQGQETYDKVLAAGGSEEDAKTAGYINLLIEGGGETIGNIAGLKLLGLGAKALNASKLNPVQAAIKGATETAVWKPWAKQLPKTAAVEMATEFGQNYGEASVEQGFGAKPEESPLMAGAHGAQAALGMTALLAPFGLGGFAMRAKRNQRIADALQDPEAPLPERIAAARIVGEQINAVDPRAASAWSQNSAVAIGAKAPILLDEEFAREAPAPEPTIEDVLSAPSVGDAVQAAAAMVEAPLKEPELIPPPRTRSRAAEMANLEAEAEQAKQADLDRLALESRLPVALQDADTADTILERSGALQEPPTAMALALQRAGVTPEAFRAPEAAPKLPDTPEQAQAMSDEHLLAARDLSRSPERKALIDEEIKRREANALQEQSTDASGLQRGAGAENEGTGAGMGEGNAQPQEVAGAQAQAGADRQSNEVTLGGRRIVAIKTNDLNRMLRVASPEIQTVIRAELARRAPPERAQATPNAVAPAAPQSAESVAPSATVTPSVAAAPTPTPAAEPKQEFASTQTALPEPVAARVKEAARALIAPADVEAEHGLEDRPHITVKYGLHAADVDAVRKVVENEPPIRARVSGIEVFSPEGKDYDVVVARVESPDLVRLNKEIADAIPHTDTHADYKPHITLGYVKRGAGQKYAQAKTGLEGTEVTFDTIEVSDQNENLTPVKLGAAPTIPAQQIAPAPAAVPVAEKPQADSQPEAPALSISTVPIVNPKIGGKLVSDMTPKQLKVFSERGGAKVKPLAQAEIERRDTESGARAMREALADENIRSQVGGWKTLIGRDEVGGRLIVHNQDTSPGIGDVVGKTQHLGQKVWFQRPDPSFSAPAARAAIDKALAGKPLGEREQRFLNYVIANIRQGEAEMAAENAVVEQLSDGWSSMSEAEKEGELDAIFGPETRGENQSAAVGEAQGNAQARESEARLEVSAEAEGQVDDPLLLQQAEPADRIAETESVRPVGESERGHAVDDGRNGRRDTSVRRANQQGENRDRETGFGLAEAEGQVDGLAREEETGRGTGTEVAGAASGTDADISRRPDDDNRGVRGGLELAAESNADILARERAQPDAEARAIADRERDAFALQTPSGTVTPQPLSEPKNQQSLFAAGRPSGDDTSAAAPSPMAAAAEALRNAADAIEQAVKPKDVVDSASAKAAPVPSAPDGGPAVESPRKAYNPNQLDLVYDDAETRPGTTQEQRDAGIQALRALLRRDRRAGASILGSALWRGFTGPAKGSDLIGQRVDGAKDLATLAQVLRDPRFETLRIFYARGNEIVGHTAWTSRLPGIVRFAPMPPNAAGQDVAAALDAKYAQLQEQMKAVGADGFWLMHNHPSGSSTPSRADEYLTRDVAARLPGFRGHVVIDHDEFSAIDDRGDSQTYRNIKSPNDETPEVPHDALRKTITGPRDLAEVGKLIQRRDGFAALIATGGSKNEVLAIAEMPESALIDKDPAKGFARVRRFSRMSGSGGHLFIVTDKPAAFGYLARAGYVSDILNANGESMLERDPAQFQQRSDKRGPKPGTLAVEQGDTGYGRKISGMAERDAAANKPTPAAAAQSGEATPAQRAAQRYIEEEGIVDLSDEPLAVNPDGTVTLYHRTTPENAARIAQTGRFVSKENTDETFFSNKPEGQGEGYGDTVVEVRVPARRVRINDAFPHEIHVAVSNKALSKRNFVRAYSTNESSAGNSQPALRRGPSNGIDKAIVENEVASLSEGWANKPKLVITQTPEEWDIGAPDDAKGAHWRGTTYLAASAHVDANEARETFFHESWHFAAWKMGKAIEPELNHLWAVNPKVRQGTSEWIANNRDVIKAQKLNPVQAKLRGIDEALAVMAQSGEKINGLQRVIAAIQKWLRSHGMDNIATWLEERTDAEALSLIAEARKFLEQGEQMPHVLAGVPAMARESTLGSGRAYLSADETQQLGASTDSRSNDVATGPYTARNQAGRGDDTPESSPASPDIAFSRGAATAMSGPLAQRARETVADIFDSSRTFNLWHRSVGTQQHKARVNPAFGKVFREAQDFLGDTSRYANEAASLAPDLLPKIDSMKDIMKSPPGRKDVEVVSDALYQGTLYGGGSPMEGLVWTDDELRGRETFGRPLPVPFNLTDKQIGLYRQALAATNKSLDELAKALILRHAKRYGLDVDREMSLEDVAQEVRDGIEDAGSQTRASLATVRDRIAELRPLVDENYDIRDFAEREEHNSRKQDLDAMLRRESSLQGKLDELDKATASVDDVENKVDGLKEHGYFPAMRFGRYAVQVTQPDENGNPDQVYFGMYENQFDANKAARELQKEFPDATVNRGVMSKEGWRLYQGLSLDALEMFAEHMVDESGNPLLSDPLVQGFLRAATNERSTLKRHIHRKGIAGFSTDVPRVLSQFTLSSARATSANYHMSEMLKAANDIKAGDVKDEAVDLVKYLQDPQEEAAWARGFLFFQYLGGSIASAAVNMTQPVMVTAPYLSQFTTYADAAAKVASAAKDFTAGKPLGERLTEDLARAKEEGLVSPQEIHQLRAEAERPVGGTMAMRKFMHVWGSLFSLAEQFNRATTFIAAYRIAQEKGRADPYAFAKTAVEDTQFIYNKGSRPNWARGTIRATVFTFKQFSISYIELAKRLYKADKKAFAIMMMTLMVMAGAEGLPFSEDLEDVIDTIGQWLGYGTNTKKALRKNITEWLGKDVAEVLLNGVSGIPGVPLDVSGRLGMHNLIPGSAIGKMSEKDKLRDVQELIGPIGGVIRAGGQAAEALAQGKTDAAARALLPSAIQNFFKGLDMAQTGMYRDAQGRKVMDTTEFEAFFKALGFQPNTVARQTEKLGMLQQDINLHRLQEDAIADKWARGIVEKDPEAVAAAKQDLKDWNERNPELAIKINPPQLQRRVKEMKKGRDERFTKAAPTELRSQVRESLR